MVLQTDGRFCHLTLASRFAGAIYKHAGPLRSTDVTPLPQLLQTQPIPSRLPPTSRGRRLYGFLAPTISRQGEGGFLQLLSMTLSPCCPLPTPPKCCAASSLRRSMLPSPKNGRLGLRVLSFRGHMGLLALGPATPRSPSFQMALSIGFGCSVSFLTCVFKLRGLDSYPGGTCTHCSCQPSHAVAQVHERLVVAVYPDNAGSRKLKVDDRVDGQSQRCGVDHGVQPLAFAGIAHSKSRDDRAGQGKQQQRQSRWAPGDASAARQGA